MADHTNVFEGDFAKATGKARNKSNGSAREAGLDGDGEAPKARRAERQRADTNMPGPAGAAAEGENGIVIPAGFDLSETGLYFQPPPTNDAQLPKPIFVCGPFEVVGECRSARSGEWGLYIRWRDRDGADHRLAIPKSRAHKVDSDLFGALEAEGLTMSPTPSGHGLFRRFLVGVRSKRRIRNVGKSGWQRSDDGWAFMLPSGEVIGAAADAIVLQAENNVVVEGYDGAGSLADWQHHVARRAVGNDLLGMAVSLAFAPPLLEIGSAANSTFHVFGVSQSGKTTAQRVALSVWGVNSETARGTLLRSWRSTSNGIESAAAESNDLLLGLGELGEVSGKEAGGVVYMVGNGSSKSRSTRSGGSRQRDTFRLLAFSTGEVRLGAKLAEEKLHETAGMEVRFMEIAADGGAGSGVFQHLHNHANGGALSEAINSATGQFHGTAGRAFLAKLVAARNADAETLADWVEGQIRGFTAANLGTITAGAVRSAARRFGLVAAAGELAIAYNVVPWPPGEAARAVGACFARWIAGRPSGTEAFEDGAAVRAVAAFIELHGESRFTLINDPVPSAVRPTSNRAGWREYVPGFGLRYLFLPEVWRTEVCKGLDASRVAKVLADKGLLERSGKNLTVHAPSAADESRPGVYAVKGAILR